MRILDNSLRPALYFWRDAYKASIRITSNEHRLEFMLALSYWQRLSRFGAFGIFAEPEPAEPPQWVYAGLEDHEDSLRSPLRQEFPSQYKRFGGHLLRYKYELLYIEAYARRNGYHIQGVGLDGGYFLMYHGKCPPTKIETTPRTISLSWGISCQFQFSCSRCWMSHHLRFQKKITMGDTNQ